jgi:uncharacterized SAM-binding protein YcdF (DUF218 family)
MGRVLRRSLVAVTAILVVMVIGVGVSGHFLFATAAEDQLHAADAVVVLGGEHDGRERYGIELARRVGARDVVMSDPYPADDPLMRTLCNSKPSGINIICRRPSPLDTRGEAIMARELGQARGWQRIIVVSWRYHLPRVRYVFSQCYSAEPGRAIIRETPRSYAFDAATWEYLYVYQYAGLIKAAVQGRCAT